MKNPDASVVVEYSLSGPPTLQPEGKRYGNTLPWVRLVASTLQSYMPYYLCRSRWYNMYYVIGIEGRVANSVSTVVCYLAIPADRSRGRELPVEEGISCCGGAESYLSHPEVPRGSRVVQSTGGKRYRSRRVNNPTEVAW